MISKDEVQRIAKLARLQLTQTEIEKLQKDMSAILDYFDLLKKAPKPQKYNFQKPGICTRKDEVISSYNIKDELVGAAPEKKDDYIKVKAIL